MASEKENLIRVTSDGDESHKPIPAQVITRGDVRRFGILIIWQMFNMINMAVRLVDWKGWGQESRSNKGWLIAGTIQTIVTVVAVIADYRVWLRTLKER
ncbi:hypothetical protein BKA56DRAFT_592937 [Ilyonectria sp. MPI-CAGE-AT-0026]|nr:hypothetical protein BKA56DRAFT_592937 [Ilyonectria sp. MPI-CAGE-AT-0026]